MALDGVYLNIIKKELESVLINGRAEKIHQPSKEEILFTIRTRDGAYKLIFNTNAGTARVHITNMQIENPKTPPMFCMLMRKHLLSGKLISIRQDGFERILYFDFDSANEMGDICRFTLAVEIMGRHSNLILINDEGKIIDSIKRVGHDMSSVRMVLPGMTYKVPPKDKRLSIFDFTIEEFKNGLYKYENQIFSKSLTKIFEGISPVFAREIEFFALRGKEKICSELSGDEIDRALFFINKTAEEVSAHKNRFTVLRTKEGQLKDFCFCNITQYGNLMVTRDFASACELLDFFYSSRDRMARTKQRASDLFKFLINTSDRISRRVANQREELKECAERDMLKLYGDLIMSNIYRLEKGMGYAEVEDYTKEGMPTVKIKLDKRLTPSQNAQKYYAEYRKADTAEKMLTSLIKNGEEEMRYIDSVFDALTRADSESDINELRAELAEQGYIKSSRIKGKPPKALPPIRFISSDGYEILVGRNNRQNDKLTLKESNKTDIWLHTQKITGSHTVIRCRGEIPPERTVKEACMIAAYHSSARESSNVPVDYTEIRYVKKPSGAKPGMVIFTNYRTVYVTPDEEFVEKLRVKQK